MELNPSRYRNFKLAIEPYLKFKPHTGYFWLDLINLLLVAMIQLAILPALMGGIVYIDLLTPWVVTGMVMQSLTHGSALGLVAALILETHSTAPAGLYICCFWVLCVAINLVRTNFSWRLKLPWFATYLISMIWVLGFENFYLFVSHGSENFDLHYLISIIGRFLIALAFGMILSHKRFPSLTDEKGLA
jgi:hypothetical protein